MKPYAYLHGMILMTNSFLLTGEYPEADTYGEIAEKYRLPGGETGACALVLDALGVPSVMQGTWMGEQTGPAIRAYFKDKQVDTSMLHDEPGYPGLEDYVIVAGATRTPLGMFGAYYSDPVRRWQMPDGRAVAGARVAGIDPYFMDATDAAVRLCAQHSVPYVTIDSHHESALHAQCAVNVVSGELLRPKYPGCDRLELIRAFADNTRGLTIFTMGAGEMLYARAGQEPRRAKAFSVKVRSTLGAGDTFKAGCVYGLFKGFDDDTLVRFASACAGVACTRFPLPLNPPTESDVRALMG